MFTVTALHLSFCCAVSRAEDLLHWAWQSSSTQCRPINGGIFQNFVEDIVLLISTPLGNLCTYVCFHVLTSIIIVILIVVLSPSLSLSLSPYPFRPASFNIPCISSTSDENPPPSSSLNISNKLENGLMFLPPPL